ncbi:TIGR02281 family clan AA aspartic protease [Vampirovibrio sp.]|uniref:TIGR02281 family clan AA aspartic protease n=1 Tax=Vampirovibrio sp. TaxID=2717857 RepID=UPI0035938F34
MGRFKKLSGMAYFKLLLLALLLILVAPINVQAQVVTPMSGGQGHKTPDYMAGVQAYRNRNYESATYYFRNVIRQDAANTNAHYYLGLSLDKLGLAGEAFNEYHFVIQQGLEAEIVHFAHERLNALASVLQVSEPPGGLGLSGISPLVQVGFSGVTAGWEDVSESVAVPLKNSRNALMVDAVLTQARRSTEGTFIIDTGATYTSISQQMAEHLGLDLRQCEKVLITTANGQIEVPKILIETLKVNGLEAHNVEATVIPVRQGSSFSGLLGLSFIRQFVVTIDPQAGHLIFKRN